MVLQALM